VAAAEVPSNGEVQLGAVRLPRGRRIVPDDHDGPVAWVTSSDVRDPGLAWAALTDLHPQTGLVPLLVQDDGRGAEGEDFFFYFPVDPRGIDLADPASELAARWVDPEHEYEVFEPFATPRSTAFLGLRGPGEGSNSLADIASAIFGMVTNDSRRQEFERLNRMDRASAEAAGWSPSGRAPDAPDASDAPDVPAGESHAAREDRPFPGLAPAVRERLSTAERTAALAGLPPARVCLVPASRPADVLAVTGWFCTDQFQEPSVGVQLGAVLRSWEERFGAHLFKIGPNADAWLLVDRPPRTREAAEPVAAEHWAFADEFHDIGRAGFPELVDTIIGRPVWHFWWD
jgi:uncharacterized protein DUF4253